MIKKCIYIFLVLCICSFSLNAQTENTFSSNTEHPKDFKFYQIENYNQLFDKNYTFVDLNININYKKKPFFQKYNSTSTLNDIYINTNDEIFTYVKSSFSLENMNRGVKIDSYNPLGISPNGTSVLFGVFGVVLDKLQN